MLHHIVYLVEPLLRWLLPGSGRHRLTGVPLIPAPPLPHTSILRGEDSPLVRPYLLAQEQREHAKQQRARRRALWLAVHGVDVGPRRIHGVDVGQRRVHGIEVTA